MGTRVLYETRDKQGINRAPVDIPVEDEKNYLIKCAVCNSYFNYMKFPRCAGKDRHGVEGVPDELKDRYNKIWGRKQ